MKMHEIKGKFNTAKVFAKTMDEVSAQQIKTLCDQAFSAGSKIRIMPDVHAGAGCTIGTTMTVKDKIVPNLVGVDIGCGMATYALKEKDIDLKKLDEFIHAAIPAGMNVRTTPHQYVEQTDLENLRCLNRINLHRAVHAMGTLGGGNHFIEADRDDNGGVYLVVHSGSRYLGKQVAEYYQEEAYKRLSHNSSADLQQTVERLKREGRQAEIQGALKALKAQSATDVPKTLAYAEGELFDDYIHDMKIVQQYAVRNRQAMAEDMINALGLHIEGAFTTIHNYIDTEAMILRKGSVSARAGETLLIPVNMRDGSLICKGKGNPDWNYSAPHGAGRLFSRAEARRRFNMEEYKNTMEGVYTTSVNEDTLDECPMAYKDMAEIMQNIVPTVDVVKIIRPIYNFKAAETAVFGKRRNKGG